MLISVMNIIIIIIKYISGYIGNNIYGRFTRFKWNWFYNGLL